MQYLKINNSTKLTDLSRAVGARNVESVLHLNGIPRVPSVGRAYAAITASKIDDAGPVSPQRKVELLNSLTSDTDIFETAALLDEDGWKLLDSTDMLPGTLKIPTDMQIPDSTNVLGDSQPVDPITQRNVINSVLTYPHTVSPTLFNTYSSSRAENVITTVGRTSSNGDPMQWFHIPWGEVTLYISLTGESVDFPVYPESISDNAHANYTTMPDLLYQFEPWNLYTSSGPRTQTYSFDFHRDMWTGDHRDGKANDLIRACEANCYPMYKGSAVYSSTVTLYVAGKPLISGIMTDVTVNWDGPLGLDGFYLHCILEITITEVSRQVLDFNTVRNKPLIG